MNITTLLTITARKYTSVPPTKTIPMPPSTTSVYVPMRSWPVFVATALAASPRIKRVINISIDKRIKPIAISIHSNIRGLGFS